MLLFTLETKSAVWAAGVCMAITTANSPSLEGQNNRLKLTFRKSYGFRTLKATE